MDRAHNHQIVSKPVGRFAPSPTGPLHFGTLIAALGSYLAARAVGGRWLLRIEDLDAPRVVAGAADTMLCLLEKVGFEWDGEVVYQSERFSRYREILDVLDGEGRTFACSCSRSEILASAPHPGEEGPIYPGTCRNGARGTRKERAIRLRVDDRPIVFHDGVFGEQVQNLESQVGDFVLHRADGMFAYQLAVVVDDIDSGVTQVVRGADLLFSTARQIYLYRCLGQSEPGYLHLPLALGEDGEKISKRHGDRGLVDSENAARMLWGALDFLGQSPPPELRGLAAPELLRWALDHFHPARIPPHNRPVTF
ncbi:MAG: tRNA glutamyl-Q(34) synthetase GluQRS [Desulfuromonas sp.]|nr:MAG: tRNA glutamyl-Q(34) synthetase GluQRS [Desulfuromonas sp.]